MGKQEGLKAALPPSSPSPSTETSPLPYVVLLSPARPWGVGGRVCRAQPLRTPVRPLPPLARTGRGKRRILMAPRLGPATGPRLRWSLPPLPWSKYPCGKVGMGKRNDPIEFRVPAHPSPKTRHLMVVNCGLIGPGPKLN